MAPRRKTSNSKLQTPGKHQDHKPQARLFMLEAWNFPGAWRLKLDSHCSKKENSKLQTPNFKLQGSIMTTSHKRGDDGHIISLCSPTRPHAEAPRLLPLLRWERRRGPGRGGAFLLKTSGTL